MDSDRPESRGPARDDRPKPQGPRPPIDITGPRLPRLVQAVTAARCFNCSAPLPSGVDWSANCPKCNAALHCCKQCAHFEPSTRFQCLKPIPREDPRQGSGEHLYSVFAPSDRGPRRSRHHPRRPAPLLDPGPKTPNDARSAFDNFLRSRTAQS